MGWPGVGSTVAFEQRLEAEAAAHADTREKSTADSGYPRAKNKGWSLLDMLVKKLWGLP